MSVLAANVSSADQELVGVRRFQAHGVVGFAFLTHFRDSAEFDAEKKN
jgi:hypothetical protein